MTKIVLVLAVIGAWMLACMAAMALVLVVWHIKDRRKETSVERISCLITGEDCPSGTKVKCTKCEIGKRELEQEATTKADTDKPVQETEQEKI